ncbi:MAG: hypothetical protein LBJ44_01280 [Propionibacteriaceae bacterium]|nr:hypothetical protein [Propionibacteriaceae bacterium]
MIVEVLFPELCSLFADAVNVQYLARSCPQIEARPTSFKADPIFLTTRPALISLGSMTESSQALVAARLRPWRDRLEELLADGVCLLATGNALEVLGTRVEHEDGSGFDGVGLFPTVARRDLMRRHNSMFLGRFQDSPVVGFKSQFSHSWPLPGAQPDPLFEVTRGVGLHPGWPGEGLRRGNFMATYLLGPLVVMNPEFGRRLLALMGVEDPHLVFEDQIEAAFRARLAEFEQPGRSFDY